MSDIPTHIEASREKGVLHVAWPDVTVQFPLHDLRASCECAQCVNEWTGEAILDPSTIPSDIHVLKLELVGSYALRIHWSDGHHQGLFTWERLRQLAGK